MIDGPTQARDLEQTDSNKALVSSFVNEVLIGGRMDRLQSYFDADNYIQHNPSIADGLSGLGAALQALAKAGVAIEFERVHRVLGEGDFVLIVSEGRFGGKARAYYDLFRVAAGKIAEHWDTIQEIPARANWKNANGKF